MPDTLVTFHALGQLGRLGNQLFQIAATVGVARHNAGEYVFPPWKYAGYFERPIPVSTRIPPVQIYRDPSFSYRDIALAGDTSLLGYFQSERYFAHCAQEIRSLFTLQPRLLQSLRAQCAPLLREKTCSMHVRRGDYVGNPLFANLAAGGYYEEAMRRFDADTLFVVFSDDIPWCRQRFRAHRCAFVGGMTEIGDLTLMSLCDGHIIANSSFSWWGAWLDAKPDKRVIAPAAWFAGEFADPDIPFKAGPPHDGFHDTADLLPAGWLRL
jgi:hypothetical protein